MGRFSVASITYLSMIVSMWWGEVDTSLNNRNDPHLDFFLLSNILKICSVITISSVSSWRTSLNSSCSSLGTVVAARYLQHYLFLAEKWNLTIEKPFNYQVKQLLLPHQPSGILFFILDILAVDSSFTQLCLLYMEYYSVVYLSYTILHS